MLFNHCYIDSKSVNTHFIIISPPKAKTYEDISAFDNTHTHLCPISRLFRKCSFQGPNYRLSNKFLKFREKGILKEKI